ncbi:SulP family inorganic anion transporter [Flavobacterium stagni]|uniref:SulP family inorganic anion transporter n=1 Tax=Flavobacterium stagni TaxID=2506421 RepID=A0A4Q1K7F1_9FLAO|nr:SulP family inorganic anion transporter [Flavobacterium stagni]RXR21656.1 SulP family inorganic anion transporter [Flavobacterium stagni]
MSKTSTILSHLKTDFSSGLVVFLVALPLCLGIALASGAPLFSGIISGVIGGIVVGLLSNSHLSVSGPAAGLTAIVLSAISELGTFELFLTTVVLAGCIQLVLGFIKAGTISNYFPNNVIEGMLAGIGVIIFLKQIPHAVGYDPDFEGDEAFVQSDGQNTLSELFAVFNHVHFGAIAIALISLLLLTLWPKIKPLQKFKFIPPALVAVLFGIVINVFWTQDGSSLAISGDHLVQLPVPDSIEAWKTTFKTPDFSQLGNSKLWVIAFTIAVVASIETLLCIEAADRMDIYKRYTNTNLELKAQGIGNILSGLIGGLPMTSVVVRTSANAASGARTKMSAIIHGILLLLCAVIIPKYLNMIPKATLAAVLLLVGYKLANPRMFWHFYKRGIFQYIPFVATFLGVVFTDLLKGVALGLIINILFILWGNMKQAYVFRAVNYKEGDVIHIDLAQEVSFLNKMAIKNTLNNLPKGSQVIIDASNTVYIAHDVQDLIREFYEIKSVEKEISVQLIGFKDAYDLENTQTTSVKIEQKYNVQRRRMEPITKQEE